MAVQCPVKSVQLLPAHSCKRSGNLNVLAGLADLFCVGDRSGQDKRFENCPHSRFKQFVVESHYFDRNRAGELNAKFIDGHSCEY